MLSRLLFSWLPGFNIYEILALLGFQDWNGWDSSARYCDGDLPFARLKAAQNMLWLWKPQSALMSPTGSVVVCSRNLPRSSLALSMY